jgi:hypothetical protein
MKKFDIIKHIWWIIILFGAAMFVMGYNSNTCS